jgi:hypothetical protein
MKVTINRKAVDKAINEMDLFPQTKEVITAYQNEVSKLDQKELELKGRLEALQCQLTSNFMEKELTDDLSLLVNLSLQAKDINSEADVLNTMLEQVNEKKLEVKFRYVPIYQQALRNDYQEVLKIDANGIVEQLRYALLKAIADLSNEMNSQYQEVAPAIYQVYEDPTIMKSFPALQHQFYKKMYTPRYMEANSIIIQRQDVFTAVEAGIVHYPNPEVKANE